jgi:hypothetical protein
MTPLPTKDLRSNIATWSVPTHHLPAVTKLMTGLLPTEKFDTDFEGQHLHTTYFDTTHFDLYKARVKKDQYLTLRIRHYKPTDTYALSAKTEDQKFRIEIDGPTAELIIRFGLHYPGAYDLLPPDLQARAAAIVADPALVPVVQVGFHRYAVEDKVNRLTLDVCVHTDKGKTLTTNVLEQKSTTKDQQPYPDFAAVGLRPMKLSKFCWAVMF